MFKPVNTQKVNENLYVIRNLFVNCYIYKADTSLIAFDAGFSPLLLHAGLKKLGLDKEDVKTVFLTHSDYDHVGGVSLFTHAKVYLPAKEVPMIDGSKARRPFMHNRRITNFTTVATSEIIHIDGVKIELLSAPGHTCGSSIYRLNDLILITGDAISINHNEVGPFSFVQNMNHKENIQTVKQLKEEGVFDTPAIIATAHYGIKKQTQ